MGMPVAYDVPITLASLLVAVVVTGLGIYVVGKGPTSPWHLIGGGTAMGLGWPPCTTPAWPRCGCRPNWITT
jgi:NO-binding membrane sensor protein with MHYT domain